MASQGALPPLDGVSPGASSDDDDEEEDTNYEAAPSLTEEERRATAVKAWSTKSDLRKIFLKASACFGEIDWNNDHEISVDEFSRSWFRGRDPHSDKVKKAMAMLGADATRNTIACESFVYNIMRRYVAIETGAKRGHFEALLTSFMKDAHRENERRVGIESNAALELKVAKLRAFNSRAKERAEQQAVAMDRLVGEKQSIARDLEQSVAREAELAARVAAYDALPPPPPAAVSAEADGESAAPADDDGRSAAAAAAAAASAASTAAALTQLQRRFDALEVSAAQSAKDRDAALREKAALGEVVAELRADIATERSKVAERQDYGPLCLKHVPQLRAALCDVPTDLKSLQNLLDDLSGALRVLVRTRPFIKGNPDEKRIGMRRRKWYRRAKKRMRAAANGELTAEQATQFETARRADMDAGDCVVADSEQCAVRIEANGELVREFKPLSDVVPYGGPLPSHSLSAPAASAEEIWSRVEPLVMSATRERPNNVVIFAYGGTGSGKTFTMGTCEEGDTAEDALSQSQRYKVFFAAARMILDELEAQKEANSRLDFVVELKMADNYLDKMNDLLDPSGPCNRMDQVRAIGTSGNSFASFFGARLFDFDSFFAAFSSGIAHRVVEAAVNEASSRSHLSICIEITRRVTNEYGVLTREVASQVVLVDLAGAEGHRQVQARIELQTFPDDKARKEAEKRAREQTNAINAALQSLQTCMQTIIAAVEAAQKSGSGGELIIPRGAFKSPLTKLLSYALRPARLPAGEERRASKVMMICCIAAAYAWHETTLKSLEFALSCMKIKLESPKQQAAKKPVIDKLNGTKELLASLRQRGEEHLATDFLELESSEQRGWYEAAKGLVREIDSAHRLAISLTTGV